MKTLGAKILELRKKNGLSQEEFGDQIGVSRQTISKWESDTMQPNFENIKIICKKFNVELSYFLDEEEVKKEAAVTTEKSKDDGKRKNTLSIILIILTGIADAFSGFMTIYFGHSVFSPNNGDYIVSIHKISPSLFYISLVCFLVFSAVEIFLIIKIRKGRNK